MFNHGLCSCQLKMQCVRGWRRWLLTFSGFCKHSEEEVHTYDKNKTAWMFLKSHCLMTFLRVAKLFPSFKNFQHSPRDKMKNSSRYPHILLVSILRFLPYCGFYHIALPLSLCLSYYEWPCHDILHLQFSFISICTWSDISWTLVRCTMIVHCTLYISPEQETPVTTFPYMTTGVLWSPSYTGEHTNANCD